MFGATFYNGVVVVGKRLRGFVTIVAFDSRSRYFSRAWKRGYPFVNLPAR